MTEKIKSIFIAYLESGVLKSGYQLLDTPFLIENEFHKQTFAQRLIDTNTNVSYVVTYQAITPMDHRDLDPIHLVTGVYTMGSNGL